MPQGAWPRAWWLESGAIDPRAEEALPITLGGLCVRRGACPAHTGMLRVPSGVPCLARGKEKGSKERGASPRLLAQVRLGDE